MGVARGVGNGDRGHQRRVATGVRGDPGEQVRGDLRPGVVRHQDARGQLGELAGHADEDHVGHAHLDRAAQGRSGEVADLDEAHLGQRR